MPDYAFPGLEDARLATGLAGFVGTLGVFLFGAGVVAVVRRRRARHERRPRTWRRPGSPAIRRAPCTGSTRARS